MIKKEEIKTVWLQITAECNLQCKYCYNLNQSNSRLTFSQVHEILFLLNSKSPCVVIFSGGEPTLDINLIDYLKTASKDYGLKTGLVTNATDLSEELLKTILDTKTFVQVSLDSLDHNIYSQLCGCNKLDNVLRNLDRLLKKNIELSISFTATKYNYKNIEQIVEYSLLKGITNIHVGLMVSTGRGQCFQNNSTISFRLLWDILYPLQLKYYKHLSIDLIEDFVYPIATGIERRKYCSAMAGNAIEVLSSGEIFACGMMPIKDFLYGSLVYEKFENIFKNIEYKENGPIFDYSKLEDCKDCELNKVCGSGCRALSYVTTGSPYGQYPLCVELKKLYRIVQQNIENPDLMEYFEFLRKIDTGEFVSTRYF